MGGWDLYGTEIWVPILASILTGGIIGFEREVNAKAAGVRTHALVCFSCTLLMMAAAYQEEWKIALMPGQTLVTDPVRMAHGILTGIGFLGAGVIFRQGSSVMGLTTAASVWMTAALGVLYGAGLFWLAVGGAVATLTVLELFRVVHWLMPDSLGVAVSVTCPRDADATAEKVTRLLRDHARKIDPVTRKWTTARADDPVGTIQLAATLWLRSVRDYDALAVELSRIDGLTEVRISPISGLETLPWD